MQRKTIAIILSLILIASVFTGCKKKDKDPQSSEPTPTEQAADSSDNIYDETTPEEEPEDEGNEDSLAVPPVLTDEEPEISKKTGMAVGYYIATGVNEHDLIEEGVTLDGYYIRFDEDGTGEICMGDLLENAMVPFSYTSTAIVDNLSGAEIPFTYNENTRSITMMIEGEGEDDFAFTFTYTGSEIPEEKYEVSAIENFDPMVIDDDVISMYVLGDSTAKGAYIWNAVITNKTDREVYVLPAYCAVDGCSVKPSFGVAIAAGEEEQVTLRWKADDLSAYGITRVDVIDMGISVLDGSTFEPIEENIRVNVFPNGEENAEYIEFHPTYGMEYLAGNRYVDVYIYDEYTEENGDIVIKVIMDNMMESPVMPMIQSVTIKDETYSFSWIDEIPGMCAAIETIIIPADTIQNQNRNKHVIGTTLQIYSLDESMEDPLVVNDDVIFRVP